MGGWRSGLKRQRERRRKKKEIFVGFYNNVDGCRGLINE
jgi:hypothetical protein